MKRLDSIQGLRMILFMTVLFFRAGEMFFSELTLYKNWFAGGGTLAVVCFVVLSGFVAGLGKRTQCSSLKLLGPGIWKRIKRFWGTHLFFLLLHIPLSYRYLRSGAEAFGNLVLNGLLLQSWVPDKSVWLGFNGVSWYLSSLVFLIAITPALHWLDGIVGEKTGSQRARLVLVLGCAMLCFGLPFFVKKNVAYWLYCFPPVRVLDYSAGFFLGKLFVNRKELHMKASAWKRNFPEFFVIGLFALCLAASPYINEGFRRVAFHLPCALLLIYIFAKSDGIVSKLFSLPWLVEQGNRTLFYMMGHVVVLRYMWNVWELVPYLKISHAPGILSVFVCLALLIAFEYICRWGLKRIKTIDKIAFRK